MRAGARSWKPFKPVLFQKCDGTRPMCGQCSRYSVAFGDCEYTDNGQSSTQMLEGRYILTLVNKSLPYFSEQISILQARIEGLEKPKDKPQASGSRGYSVAPSQMSPSTAMGLGPLLTHFCGSFHCRPQSPTHQLNRSTTDIGCIPGHEFNADCESPGLGSASESCVLTRRKGITLHCTSSFVSCAFFAM